MLDDLRRPGEAARLGRAVALRPSWAEARRDLGAALEAQGQVPDAIREYQRAVALKPNLLSAHVRLGETLARAGRLTEALAAFERAKAINPDFTRGYVRTADLLVALGQPEAARKQYERALALDPADRHARWQRGRLSLLQGDFDSGWDDFDARPGAAAPEALADTPRWAGEDAAGLTVLVRGEYDPRETIQGLRFVPRLAARGARIVLDVDPTFQPLLPDWDGVVIAEPGVPNPPVDAWSPLGDLVRHLCTAPAEQPATVPYLRPPAARIRAAGAPLRVVLAWNATPTEHALPFAAIERLVRLPGIGFIALEESLTGAESRALAAAHISDAWSGHDDFTAMAAVLAEADLVIATDNVVAHLAGALGHEVWLALAKVPDWRWQLEREDSPWYPTMRLIRQTKAGDWSAVLDRVEGMLAEVAFPDA